MYNIAEIKRLHTRKNSDISAVEKSTFEPINTAAIRYPNRWLLNPFTLDLP